MCVCGEKRIVGGDADVKLSRLELEMDLLQADKIETFDRDDNPNTTTMRVRPPTMPSR